MRLLAFDYEAASAGEPLNRRLSATSPSPRVVGPGYYQRCLAEKREAIAMTAQLLAVAIGEPREFWTPGRCRWFAFTTDWNRLTELSIFAEQPGLEDWRDALRKYRTNPVEFC